MPVSIYIIEDSHEDWDLESVPAEDEGRAEHCFMAGIIVFVDLLLNQADVLLWSP